MWRLGRALWATLALSGACGGEVEREVQLARVAPAADPLCGAPADARTLIIRALGDFPAAEATAQTVSLDQPTFRIERFPAATRALSIEVRGFAGALRAVGRTGELELDTFEHGDAVPIFLAPPDGSCPTGPPLAARDRPLVARAGEEVLIAGGIGPEGEPVHRVELYQPATGAFLDLGEPLYGTTVPRGLDGASMTTLPGGAVAVVGGGATAYQLFDPAERVFGPAVFLPEARARHAALALPDGRLFLAGGCARVQGTGCEAGSALATTSILDPESGRLEAGPSLAQRRIGGHALWEGPSSVLLAGGVDADGAPVTAIERVDLDAGTTELLSPAPGHAAALLPSGSLVAAFAPPEAGADAAGSLVPVGGAARVLAGDRPRTGAALLTLESGAVLAAGDGPAALWTGFGGWRALPADDGVRRGGAALRLGDGSVLLLGGRDEEGQVRGDAAILRPALGGAWSPSASATFASPESAAAVVLRDPARGALVAAEGGAPAHLRVEVGDVGEEWLVVAGPRFDAASVEALAEVQGGGLAALFGWSGPGEHHRIELRPGEPARLVRVAAGAREPAPDCAGLLVPEGALAAGTHEIAWRVAAGELALSVDGAELLRCELDAAAPRGLVGLAFLGAGATARVDVLTATR